MPHLLADRRKLQRPFLRACLGWLAVVSACFTASSQPPPLSATATAEQAPAARTAPASQPARASRAAGGAQRDLEACFARAPEPHCRWDQQTCVEAADAARWGAADLELIGCYRRTSSGWVLASKRIDRGGTAVLFEATATAHGIACYFYGTDALAGLAPEARDLATQWAGCTEMLQHDPF